MGKDRKPLKDMTDEEIDQMTKDMEPVEDYLDRIAKGDED